jgi:hypothetical protein
MGPSTIILSFVCCSRFAYKKNVAHDFRYTHVYKYIHIYKGKRESNPVTGPVWPRGWVEVLPRPYFTLGKDPVPNVQEAGWAPGPVWTGAENLAPTGIRSPARPARSSFAIPTELPGPQYIYVYIYVCVIQVVKSLFYK